MDRSQEEFQRKPTTWLAPDKSLCFLCAWILVKSSSLHSYTTAFDAPFESMAYITSPLFQLGSSVGILVSCAAVMLLAKKGMLASFSMPVALPAVVLSGAYAASALGIYSVMPANVAFVVLGLVWGLTTNMLALALIELLASEKSLSFMAVQLATGFLAAAAIASALQDMDPFFSSAVCILFVMCAVPLIRLCREGRAQDAPDAGQDSFAACFKENAPLLLVFFIAEAIVGMMNMFAFGSGETLVVSAAMPVTGMTVCAVLFLGVFALTSNAPSSHVLFTAVIPIMMALLLLLPFAGVTHGGFLSTLLSGIYYLTALTATYCYVRSCKKRHVCIYLFAAMVCGVERLVLLLGLGLGLFVGSSFPGDAFMKVTALVFAAVYALALVLLVPSLLRKRKSEDVREELSEAPSDSSDLLATVSDEYGLTPREVEVLALLARGRDVGFVSEELSLSRNTVQGYVKSIYVKLGVHSRRELHDLLEGWQ